MAFPSDLARTKNGGTELMHDKDLEGQFDLIIDWIMAALNAATGHKHDGTANEGPKVLINNLNIASAAQGDIIFRGAAAFARLGFGTSGLPLVTKGTGANPLWEALAAVGLAADCVETAKIKNLNVTTGKLAAGAVTAAKASSLFGTWATQQDDTLGGGVADYIHDLVYLAATDGFVVVGGSRNTGVSWSMWILTDGNNPPTTVRHFMFSTINDGSAHHGMMCPVKKGDYWKLTGTGLHAAGGANGAIFWLPMGV